MKNNLIAKKLVSILLVLVIVVTALFANSTFVSAAQDSKSGNILGNSLYLSEYNIVLNTGEKKLLHAFTSSNLGIQNAVKFFSKDTSIAKVSSDGTITAVSKGTTVIDVTANGSNATASCTVVVTDAQVPTTQPTTTPPTTVPPTTVPPTTASYPITLSTTSANLYKGNYYQINAKCDGNLTWSSSNTSVATVSDGIVTALSAGTADITIKSQSHSASFRVTVKNPTSTVNIYSNSITFERTKTYFLNSTTSGVKWKSSDTSIATVDNGLVYGNKAGKCVITAYTSSGEATCLVTIKGSAVVKFAYTSPNSAVLNSNVNFIAITDQQRTAVKFDITMGGTTSSVTATSKVADGDTYIWTATKKMTVAGEYSVKAYSQYNNDGVWSTCSDANTTAFVTNVTSKDTTSCETRRPSDELVALIANYEGFLSSVTPDNITCDPTLGHGVLVYPGDCFYNNITRKEAYAYLVQSVNNEGYASSVNKFYINNNVKFNQYQYDAMVCFVYNLGYGVLVNDDELTSILLDCYETASTTPSPAAGVAGYVNDDYVNFRSGPSLSDSIIKTMEINTQFTFLSGTLYNNEWYNIKLSDGTTGYIYYEYASVKPTGVRNLNYVNESKLVQAVLQYHHAAGSCYWGLLYRRIDEMEIFFHKDYIRDGQNNKYGYKFTCASNPSFSI